LESCAGSIPAVSTDVLGPRVARAYEPPGLQGRECDGRREWSLGGVRPRRDSIRVCYFSHDLELSGSLA
jgi:hypothetical protein